MRRGSILKSVSPGACFWVDDLRQNGKVVAFAAEVILTPAETEVALLAPVRAIRVAQDPVLHVLLLVVAPADKCDRVGQLEPLETPFELAFHADATSGFNRGGCASADLGHHCHLFSCICELHGVHVDRVVSQDTASIGLEALVGVEIHEDGTVSTQLLENHLLVHAPVVAAKIVGVLDFGASLVLAVRVRGAAAWRPVAMVRRALLVHSVEVFQENSVREAPTSVAAFVQKVTIEPVLHR